MEFETSGSTGEPRLVQISQSALDWSAAATHSHLGGPGRWVEALPPDRVGGFQVLNRARLAGEAGIPHPLAVCGTANPVSDFEQPLFPLHLPLMHFSVPKLIEALELAFTLPPAPVYLSLVPTELYAVFHAPDQQRDRALNLLARCCAILVGGAALDSALRQDAGTRGLNIVQTYGMTETCGGCIYDGVPLPGVSVRLHAADDAGVGIIELSGPMLADGYLEPLPFEQLICTASDQTVPPYAHPKPHVPAPLPTPEPSFCARTEREQKAKPAQPRGVDAEFSTTPEGGTFYYERGIRWFRTSDLGRWHDDGKLEVIGRADDVIITGGVNVHPHLVEDALESVWFSLTGAETQIVVIGKPHAKWGHQVVAVIEHPGVISPTLAGKLQALAREKLGSVATPKQFHTQPEFPTLPGGKVDRKQIARLIEIPS